MDDLSNFRMFWELLVEANASENRQIVKLQYTTYFLYVFFLPIIYRVLDPSMYLQVVKDKRKHRKYVSCPKRVYVRSYKEHNTVAVLEGSWIT
jgi:hypothetical protein